jgi:hypothetical protein
MGSIATGAWKNYHVASKHALQTLLSITLHKQYIFFEIAAG